MPVISVHQRLRQEDHELKDNSGLQSNPLSERGRDGRGGKRRRQGVDTVDLAVLVQTQHGHRHPSGQSLRQPLIALPGR